MTTPLSDTHPRAAALQLKLLRQATPARKLEMVGQLNQMVKDLALSGLREHYPHETPAQLRRRLADLLLGKDLARRVYGAAAGEDGNAL